MLFVVEHFLSSFSMSPAALFVGLLYVLPSPFLIFYLDNLYINVPLPHTQNTLSHSPAHFSLWNALAPSLVVPLMVLPSALLFLFGPLPVFLSLLYISLLYLTMPQIVRLANSKAGIKPIAPLLAFDKENSIEFSLDSVYYLYKQSNPNPVLLSRTSL